MATNITASWTAPPLTELAPDVSKSCELGARWVAELFNSIVDDDRNGSLPMQLTVAYLNTTLPSNWTRPTPGDVLAWWAEQLSDVENDTVWDYWASLMAFPIDQCNRTICTDLKWQGDADISGQGMLVSYYVVAILSLIWFVAIYLGGLSSQRGNSDRKGISFKILRAFRESSNDFLDATLIFSAAMLLAAVTRYAAVQRNPDRPYSVYSLFGSVFVTTFTVFPALVVQTVTGRVRKHWLRLFLWLVVIASSITVEYYYKKVYEEGYWETETDWGTHNNFSLSIPRGEAVNMVEGVWVRNCDNKGMRRSLEHLLTIGHIWLGLNLVWWLWYLLMSIVPQGWKDRRKNGRLYGLFKKTQRTILFFNGVVCIGLMFSFIGAFQIYTLDVEETAGPDLRRNGTWTFGQVLALATWVPVLVQFATVLLFGERGMSAKFSPNYKVVPTKDAHQEKNVDSSEQSLPLNTERMV